MATRVPPEGQGQTANEAFLAALIRHQMGLVRYAGYVSSRVIGLLNRAEAEMADRIRSRLLNNTGLSTPAEIRRYESLIKVIENIRTNAFAQATEELITQMQDLAVAEAQFIQTTTLTTAPAIIQTAMPATRQLKAIALSRPFQGRLLRDWARTIMSDDLARIRGQIQAGMVAGDTSAVIARRIVGTARLRGGDGVTEITRRAAMSLTRTAVNHVATVARNEFFEENSDLFDEEQFVATLDSRTTLVCASNDGKRFPIGRGPMPPLHWQCRSVRVPVLDGQVLSARPAKAITEQQIMREYNAANGTSARDRKSLPRGHKGSYDKFRRQRIREMTGQVPGTTTYDQFLRSQPASFQNDVLGITKAKLFREGNLTLDRFVARDGSELSLSQLARTDAAAFKAAGLNPGDYL